MRTFYLETQPGREPAVGAMVLLGVGESHHLFQVMRLREGAMIRLTDGRARVYGAEVCGRDEGRAEIRIATVAADTQALAEPRLVLACAVVKGKRFEWALEKSVELGVHRIVPLLTERGVITPGSGRQKRWHKILLAGLKQSGRSLLPELADPADLARVVAAADAPLLWGAATEDSADVPVEGPPPLFWHRLKVAGERPRTLTVLIGPEGGWTAAERQQLSAARAVPLILGPHVLRTETAAVAAMFALQGLRRLWQEEDRADEGDR